MYAEQRFVPATLHRRQSKWVWIIYYGLIALAVSIAIGLAVPVQAAPAVPAATAWVTDTTGTLSAAQRESLNQRLAALEKEKGAQIFVLMVPSTGEDTIESYAQRVFDAWRVGRKNIDDGVLVLVAKDDRRMRIQTGYGLEGAITDLQAGRIIREQMAPAFAQGDYFAGVEAAIDNLVLLTEGEELPAVASTGSTQYEADELTWEPLLAILFMAFMMPAGFAAFAGAVFALAVTASIPIALGVGILAFLISKIGRMFGAGGRASSGRASRHGSAMGGLGGGIGGFRGGGGGFGGGGGGSSGGGGASGSW